MQLKEGDKVKTLRGSIDGNRYPGKIGYVQSFARFSSYHGREAYVTSNPEGSWHSEWCGWFWVCDVEKID